MMGTTCDQQHEGCHDEADVLGERRAPSDEQHVHAALHEQQAHQREDAMRPHEQHDEPHEHHEERDDEENGILVASAATRLQPPLAHGVPAYTAVQRT